ncbi:MAG: AraC family transcriptional regulator [Opitutales bacterium]
MNCSGPYLDQPPAIEQFGVGIHGHRSLEHYCLPDLACLHHYDYAGSLKVDGQAFTLRPGCATLIPPGADLWYFLDQFPSRHRYVHFKLRRQWDGPSLPLLIEPGPLADRIGHYLHQLVRWAPFEPARAQSLLWEALWQWRDAPGAIGTAVHPLVGRAVALIEQRLEDARFRVGQLADSLEVSHNHLNRLFRRDRGQTMGGYLRERRLQRARFYLESTDLMPGQIGRRCGYPDPHHFNKWIRRHLGQPPSHWRS